MTGVSDHLRMTVDPIAEMLKRTLKNFKFATAEIT